MPASTLYDPTHVRDFYDDYGEREWQRLESDAANRIYFHVHLHYLKQIVKPGDEVLEIGAGPGRFTVPMAELGAFITVADISQRQLDLNKERIQTSELAGQIRAWQQADVTNLIGFGDQQFGVTVAYGGLLSYTMEKERDAINELLRVTKSGGYVLLSVMSKWGAARNALGGILRVVDELGIEALTAPLTNGNVFEEFHAHHRFHLYSSDELRNLFQGFSCDIVQMSASNFLSLQNNYFLQDRWNDPVFWKTFIDWEITASSQAGTIDAGSHIIVVLRKR